FAALNVVASMQPSHLLTDAPGIWRLTPARAGRAFALRDLVEAARRAGREARELVWLGSDAPIVPPRWEDTLAAATLRRAPELPASESVAPEQAISQELTLELMRAE